MWLEFVGEKNYYLPPPYNLIQILVYINDKISPKRVGFFSIFYICYMLFPLYNPPGAYLSLSLRKSEKGSKGSKGLK